jgi:hypothetical protein
VTSFFLGGDRLLRFLPDLLPCKSVTRVWQIRNFQVRVLDWKMLKVRGTIWQFAAGVSGAPPRQEAAPRDGESRPVATDGHRHAVRNAVHKWSPFSQVIEAQLIARNPAQSIVVARFSALQPDPGNVLRKPNIARPSR